jgi:hypothetical protein
MKLTIQPNVSAGPIEFGMSSVQVRKNINKAFKSFKRTPLSAHPCDYFEEEGIFVYYEADGRVEAVEFVEPAEPTFENKNLLTVSFAELVAFFEKRDESAEIDTTEFTSKLFGIGASAPLAKESPEKPAESVIAFRKGYYD